VRSLLAFKPFYILIPFDFWPPSSRRIVMLESSLPYLSSSLVVPFVLHKVCCCLSACSGDRILHFLWLSSCFVRVIGVGRRSPPPGLTCAPHPCLTSVIFAITHSIHTPYVQLVEAILVYFPPDRSSCSSWISSATRIKNQNSRIPPPPHTLPHKLAI